MKFLVEKRFLTIKKLSFSFLGKKAKDRTEFSVSEKKDSTLKDGVSCFDLWQVESDKDKFIVLLFLTNTVLDDIDDKIDIISAIIFNPFFDDGECAFAIETESVFALFF